VIKIENYQIAIIESALLKKGYEKIYNNFFKNSEYKIRLTTYLGLDYENIETGKTFSIALSCPITESKLIKFLDRVDKFIADPKIEIVCSSRGSLNRFTFFRRAKIFDVKGFEIELYNINIFKYEITYRHKDTGYRFKVKYGTLLNGEIYFLQFNRRQPIVPYEILKEFIQQLDKSITNLNNSYDSEFLHQFHDIKKFAEKSGYKVGYFKVFNENWFITWSDYFLVYSIDKTEAFCVNIENNYSFLENLKILLNALKHKEITDVLMTQSKGY